MTKDKGDVKGDADADDRAAADDFDDKKRSLLGPIPEEHVKEGTAIANLGAISATHEQIEGSNLAEMIIKKSFIQASTDEPQTFKQKDLFTPEPPAPPREALGGLLKWPETDADLAAREKRDEVAREDAHKKALAMTAEHKKARDARVDASYERARSQDLNCLALINEWVAPMDKMEQLSSSGLVEGEIVIATLPVVGVVGGPPEISGKIGAGSLCLTRLPEKQLTNKDGTKQTVQQHRFHWLIQESVASFGYKEFAEYKKALVQKEDFGKPKSVLTHGIHRTAEKSEEHCAEQTAVVQANRSEHMVIGAYSVMKMDNELFHAHAEWQDTAKLSAYFEAKAETTSSSEKIRDLSQCSFCFCGKTQRFCLCGCSEACCFGICHAGKNSCCKEGLFSCLSFSCPELHPCCCCEAVSGALYKETKGQEQAGAGASVKDMPKLEQFLVQYEKASQASTAPTGAGLVMAREASETPLTPEGDTVTTKFTKKLHTLHMLYRSPDSLWSNKDKLEAVVLVIAPDTKMGAVVNFVSNMELFFPNQQQYKRDTLDPLEVRRLAKSVEGPFSSMKVKTPAATRTGSQSGSTTSTLDNTKSENKLGELEAELDEIIGTDGKKSKLCKMPFACCAGPRSCALKAMGLKGGDGDEAGGDDDAAPENMEMGPVRV